MIPILNKASLAVALFALYSRARGAQSVKTEWRNDKTGKVRLESSTLRTLVRLSFIELILTAILTIISLI